MSSATGLHILHDTGAPAGSNDYTTLVLLHGYIWHSEIFRPLLPLARTHNARILCVNRRGYPGARPYTPAERAPLEHPPGPGAPLAEVAAFRARVAAFYRERGRELHALLLELAQGGLPKADRGRNRGGIVVLGWSFGTTWMHAMLADVAAFDAEAGSEIDLGDYVRRVVLYEPLVALAGYPPPRDAYNPFADPAVVIEEQQELLMNWISGYFLHGPDFSDIDTLERRQHLPVPRPTLTTMSVETVGDVTHAPAGSPGGADHTILQAGLMANVYPKLRERMLRLPAEKREDGKMWEHVEVRVVWGDMSIWESPGAVMYFKKELEDAKKRGIRMRSVTFARVRGANHLAHWDFPEKTLRAILGTSAETELE
ncbi:Alpha/Beta hydrolase protein [Epithele typhae]|uniref:Alpha/Beta hydrolase protein n=1 Tax=Epithele typhae TaxID=378194 RepID=UPI0020081ECF|nr:Alpha/Beta hydrolase protein [Epithele typhae]KAH9913819.1 Alpha/Beta hydrolase protein [Epithele typhae]